MIVFIVIPLAAGRRSGAWLSRSARAVVRGDAPAALRAGHASALLATLVLIFAFQADNIASRSLHVLLIAVPITLQVYFNASLAYGLMRRLKVDYAVAAPGALIGASNFFELAVATAIALFGPDSGAALATVVGVLWRSRSCCRSVRRDTTRKNVRAGARGVRDDARRGSPESSSSRRELGAQPARRGLARAHFGAKARALSAGAIAGGREPPRDRGARGGWNRRHGTDVEFGVDDNPDDESTSS